MTRVFPHWYQMKLLMKDFNSLLKTCVYVQVKNHLAATKRKKKLPLRAELWLSNSPLHFFPARGLTFSPSTTEK